MSAARLDRLGGGLDDLFMHKIPQRCAAKWRSGRGREVHAMGCVPRPVDRSVSIILREGGLGTRR